MGGCVATTGAKKRNPSASAGGNGLVLLYHRVARVAGDPQLLCVTPEHFSEHLEVLRRLQRPVTLSQLAALCSGARCPGNVAMTFDDGYRDNLDNAKPILERFDVGATVFVVPQSGRACNELWWDELARIILKPGTLCDPLRLTIAGSGCVQPLHDAATYTQEDCDRDSGWNVLSDDRPNPRQSLYEWLFSALRPLSFASRRAALDELSRQSSESIQKPTETLSPDRVSALAEGGLVDIGAHTLTHPVLAGLPITEQREEIAGSKRLIEDILDRPVRSFSYPFGTRRDYSAETVRIVRESGFDNGCSNFNGVVSPASDRFQLPRLIVRDWDGDAFARHIEAEFARV